MPIRATSTTASTYKEQNQKRVLFAFNFRAGEIVSLSHFMIVVTKKSYLFLSLIYTFSLFIEITVHLITLMQHTFGVHVKWDEHVNWSKRIMWTNSCFDYF